MLAFQRTGLLLSVALSLSVDSGLAAEFVYREHLYRFRHPDDWKVVYGGEGPWSSVGLGTADTHPRPQGWNGPLIGVFPFSPGNQPVSVEKLERMGRPARTMETAAGLSGVEYVDEDGTRVVHLYPTSRGRRFAVFLQHPTDDPQRARYEAALESVIGSLESEAGWEAAEHERRARGGQQALAMALRHMVQSPARAKPPGAVALLDIHLAGKDVVDSRCDRAKLDFGWTYTMVQSLEARGIRCADGLFRGCAFLEADPASAVREAAEACLALVPLAQRAADPACLPGTKLATFALTVRALVWPADPEAPPTIEGQVALDLLELGACGAIDAVVVLSQSAATLVRPPLRLGRGLHCPGRESGTFVAAVELGLDANGSPTAEAAPTDR